MPKIEFIELVIGLGVPGLALGLFYLLFKKLNITVPPSYQGPVAILFLVIVGGITFYALHNFSAISPDNEDSIEQPVNEPKNDKPEVEEKGDKSDEITETEEDKKEEQEPKKVAIVDDFTINLKAVSNDPFPKLAATIVNRSGGMQVIMGCKVEVRKFSQKKGDVTARLLEALDSWEIELPLRRGTFEYDRESPIVLPDQTPVLINLIFNCKDNGASYHPSEYGLYKFMISFITDTGLELKYEEEITIP